MATKPALVTPAPAARLHDRAGVCYGGGYASVEHARWLFAALDVRHARIGQVSDDQDELANALADLGVDLCRIINPTTALALASQLRAVVRAGRLRFLEVGPNEQQGQIKRIADWSLEDRKRLLDNGRIIRAITGILGDRAPTIISPALALKADGAAWLDQLSAAGTLKGIVDHWNAHLYRGGEDPFASERLEQVIASATKLCGPVSGVVTETGWHNDASVSGSEHHYTPPEVAAVYLPRVLLEADRRDLAVYFYEATDDPSAKRASHEQHFGLSIDRTLKPAGAALAMMQRLYATAEGEPQQLSVQAYAPEGVRTALHGRADGSALLSLYQPLPIWDAIKRTPMTVQPVPVPVWVPASRRLTLHRPTLGTSVDVTAQRGKDGLLSVPALAEATVLELGVRT